MYTAIIYVVRFILWVINGRIKVENKENLPQDTNYILVAPHRSAIDPVALALAAYPEEFSFMVKEELEEKALLRFLSQHLGFVPVNRDNPKPSALKEPVRILREGKKSFMLFPTGSRYSSDMKSGAITIAKLSKKTIVPAVYDGPYTMKDLIKRKQMTVRFGNPISIDSSKKKDELLIYNDLIQDRFDQIQKEIDGSKK